MAVEIERFCGLMERVAPLSGAYGWDNSGLVIKSGQEVSAVCIALDATVSAVKWAYDNGCDMLLTHHPLLFSPEKHIWQDSGEGAVIHALIRNGVSLYCAHTSMDCVAGGINDELAKRLMLSDIVPVMDEEGGYCMRVGKLEQEVSCCRFASYVKQRLNCGMARFSDTGGSVKRVAVCGGAGGSMLSAAAAAGADALVTGELKYHNYLSSEKTAIVELGHYETESLFCDIAMRGLQKAANELQYNIRLLCAETNRPYRYAE